jgi:signal transduction histidine kinase
LAPGLEQGLEQMLGHAPVAVAVVTGEAHTLLYGNAAFQEFARVSGAAPAVAPGASIAAAVSPDAAPVLLALLDEVRRSGRPVRGGIPARPIECADDVGRRDAWPCTAWPVAEPFGAGTTGRAIVVLVDASAATALARLLHRDVTERVLLSALREETRADVADVARATAEDANTARGRLLAATSHELRTPLQAIGGYAEILGMELRGPLTDGQRDALGRIQHAMRHLLTLATALLEHTRTEAGTAPTDVPVSVAVQDAAQLVEPQADAKGLTLTTTVPDAAPLVVRADAARLRQVLINLLANAVKFTPPGGAIRVSWALATEPGSELERVAIRVADTGCGIAADQLGRVFDPYVQVGAPVGGPPERRRTLGEAGVGLGLAISRELARGMGGEITVESAVGAGSTFTVMLPGGAERTA